MRFFPRPWMVAALLVAAAACSSGTPPTAPTLVVATPTATVPTAPAVPTALTSLALAMPIDAADAANTAFGLAPFGYHGADHAESGHPGWDLEYRAGGAVRAAADGTVEAVVNDERNPGRTRVHVSHQVGQHFYRTVYTNLLTVAPDIAEGQVVRRGQPLGVAGGRTATIGGATVTYAMTHFQLDDL